MSGPICHNAILFVSGEGFRASPFGSGSSGLRSRSGPFRDCSRTLHIPDASVDRPLKGPDSSLLTQTLRAHRIAPSERVSPTLRGPGLRFLVAARSGSAPSARRRPARGTCHAARHPLHPLRSLRSVGTCSRDASGVRSAHALVAIALLFRRREGGFRGGRKPPSHRRKMLSGGRGADGADEADPVRAGDRPQRWKRTWKT